MNLRRVANRLQLALLQKGRCIRINQVQRYSERAGRMVTKFVLQETRNVCGKKKNVTILDGGRMEDVVKTLAELYGERDEADAETESLC